MRRNNMGLRAKQTLLFAYLSDLKPDFSVAYQIMKAILKSEGRRIPSQAAAWHFLKQYKAEHRNLVIIMREGATAFEQQLGIYQQETAQ